MALPKVNDWPAFRRHLKLLADAFPDQFTQWVLIGGGACWFYRTVLERWADTDFPAPKFSRADETVWLSKDIDFMGATEKEAAALLGAPFKPESHTFSFQGIEVDFLQEGVCLTRKDALRNARQARTPEFVFRVLDAGWLYAEKLAVIRHKERVQDRLHLLVLETFLKCEFCREVEDVSTLDADEWVERARTVKTADHGFFTRDEVFLGRLQRGIRRLNAPEHRALKHWAKHHLPGYQE
jgi:hypothetical protein